MEKFLSDIPEGTNHPWEITIDGERTSVRKIDLDSKYGRFEFGMRPEGYPSWTFTETEHGGAVTVPYCVDPSGNTLVGLILEDRANMGGKRWCAIGGFKNPFETASDTQARELKEEVDPIGEQITIERQGTRFNCNRLFFVADAEKDQGIQTGAFEVSYETLQPTDIPKAVGQLPGQKSNVVFFRWEDAVLEISGDGIALAAIAQVIARQQKKSQ